jgi:hypothetical protein
MGFWKKNFRDFIIILKLLVLGSYAMYLETCSTVLPLKGELAACPILEPRNNFVYLLIPAPIYLILLSINLKSVN